MGEFYRAKATATDRVFELGRLFLYRTSRILFSRPPSTMLLGDMQMIDFSRSTFTWKSHPCTPDPHYRWQGGFVGEPGQVYHVRFTLDARCAVQHPDRAEPLELFLGSPCRSEYTIARRNLFQVPSTEWRMAFSRACQVTIGASVDDVEEVSPRPLTEVFADHTIDIRQVAAPRRLADAADIAAATLDGCLLNGISSYRDQDTGCMVTVEYPVNVMNLNAADEEWQVCTGPVILPDLTTWDGAEVGRVLVAHVAMSHLDHVEFILRRPVEVAPDEVAWLDQPRGRDRLELRDPTSPPPAYPPPRPRPTVYRDVLEFAADNAVLADDVSTPTRPLP